MLTVTGLNAYIVFFLFINVCQMNRRFVNLALGNYKSRTYSLHRLDVPKHLFYPSKNNGGGGDKDKLPKIVQFQPCPTSPYGGPLPDDMFVLLGANGSCSEAGRILHPNEAGHALLYDADSCSAISMPSLNFPKGHRHRPIPFAVAGAGPGEENLYVMSSIPRPTLRPFRSPARCCSVNFELDTWVGFSTDHPYHLCAADLSAITMAPRQAPVLQHVWEDFNPLPTEKSLLVLNQQFPGIVLHTTTEWFAEKLHLVNLGSGRFCIAKVFQVEETVWLSCSLDDERTPEGKLMVLTGVEVVRGGEEGEHRMVKHSPNVAVSPAIVSRGCSE